MSATTPITEMAQNVETRILCADDRRGIYTELTPAGRALLKKARPTHDRVLEESLDRACETPELAALVDALHKLPATG